MRRSNGCLATGVAGRRFDTVSDFQRTHAYHLKGKMMKIKLVLAAFVLSAIPAPAQTNTVAKTNIGESFSKAALSALVVLNASRGSSVTDKVEEALNAMKAERAPLVGPDRKVNSEGVTEFMIYSFMYGLSYQVENKEVIPNKLVRRTQVLGMSDTCVSDITAQLHARNWTDAPKSCQATLVNERTASKQGNETDQDKEKSR